MRGRSWSVPLAFVLIGLVALLASGCAAPLKTGTAAEAKKAFQQLYPAYTPSSAVASGTAWLVRATAKSIEVQPFGGEPYDSPPAVANLLIAVTCGGAGRHSTVLDGVTWTADADLEAILRSNRDGAGTDTPLSDELAYDLEQPGSVISGARAASDTVSVSYTGPSGQRWDVTYSWETDAADPTDPGGWVSDTSYPKSVYQEQVALLRPLLGAFQLSKGMPADPKPTDPADVWSGRANVMAGAVQDFALHYDTASPAEPKKPGAPQAGTFVARIVAVDPVARTITIDRIQLFIGDSAYAAAKKDHAQAPNDDVYVRNRVRERIVLPLGEGVAVTTFDPIRPWQPALGQGNYASITALDADQFFAEYRETTMADMGAWIVVSGGRVIAVIGNYSV